MSVTSRDVRVYCGTSSYQAGYLWAIVAALLFMAIAPVYYTIYYTSPLYATAAHLHKLLLLYIGAAGTAGVLLQRQGSDTATATSCAVGCA